MSPAPQPRAYTMRLAASDPKVTDWSRPLWLTHEAMNRGTQAFGDWLLSFRGGISHSLADQADCSAEEKAQRRRLLALSWLTVETAAGAPQQYIVAKGTEARPQRRHALEEALQEILKQRGLEAKAIEEWLQDCLPSLEADIREDAVWVNRSKAFDELRTRIQTLDRGKIWDLLEPFFGSPEEYVKPLASLEEGEVGAKQLVHQARSWLSRRLGQGKGADFDQLAQNYQSIGQWAKEQLARTKAFARSRTALSSLAKALGKSSQERQDDLPYVLAQVSAPGHKSQTRNLLKALFEQTHKVSVEDLQRLAEAAEKDSQTCCQKKGQKGKEPYATAILKEVEKACGIPYYSGGKTQLDFYDVMLDHAARRVCAWHTWIKRAEKQRCTREENIRRLSEVPQEAIDWLDEYCRYRGEASGAQEEYYIRPNALGGWEEIVEAWTEKKGATVSERIALARELQSHPEIERFGDIQLFEALAEAPEIIWQREGEPAPEILCHYAEARQAEVEKRRYKVPTYCHPDALRHPVFCDFGDSRPRIDFSFLNPVRKGGTPPQFQEVTLELWDGCQVGPHTFRWQSKRFRRELVEEPPNTGEQHVPRRTRLAQAALGLENLTQALAAWKKKGNGRLQVPRDRLEALADHIQKHGWDKRACQLRRQLPWVLSFSAQLEGGGPWVQYAPQHNLPLRPPLHKEENRKRKVLATLHLCRLPQLRVLAVDLGHRYAAACAVWETLTSAQLRQECQHAGQPVPSDTDLFFVLKHNKHRVIYRRLGPDILASGKPHPAPWARLERQFFIKLQGEEQPAREAANEELWFVHSLEMKVGRSAPLLDRLYAAGFGHTRAQQERLKAWQEFGWHPPNTGSSPEEAPGVDTEGRPTLSLLKIDELLFWAVTLTRRALERHARRAKIAFYLQNAETTALEQALLYWFQLFRGMERGTWCDKEAEQLWQKYIEPLLQEPLTFSEAPSPQRASQSRRQREQELRRKLQPVVAHLLADRATRQRLSECWANRWKKEDELFRCYLRELRKRILPRASSLSPGSQRHLGGLSLTRLATIQALYRLHKAYHTRPEPEDVRKNIPAPQERGLKGFGGKILKALDHLRENRLKQLASRIVEAALGIGAVSQPSAKRPDKPRYAPCQAVVMENLAHYRPDITQPRRENRQLMAWAARNVRRYLQEACELHGLLLYEINPAYSSIQDSRTGAPGLRCRDVSWREFLHSRLWRREVARAAKETRPSARLRLLREVDRLLREQKTQQKGKLLASPLRLPLEGGEIFVSADEHSPIAGGIQADLNAAANLGIRALLDPDWPGAWWYVPCEGTNYCPLPDRTEGSAAMPKGPLLVAAQSIRKRTRKKDKKIVYLWRDISSQPLSQGKWFLTKDYWNRAEEKVIRRLREQLGLPEEDHYE